jgi:hypothetical protein
MKESVNIVIFNLKPDASATDALSDRFGEDSNVNLSTIRLYKDVNNFIQDNSNAIFIFKVQNKAEFVQVLAIIKSNRSLIEAGLLKPICLLGINSEKAERLLFKYGCRDILDINVKPRSLVIKAEMMERSISNILNRDDNVLSLGQRFQESEDEKCLAYNSRKFPNNDFVEDELELEKELNKLVVELELEKEDQKESLLNEFDNDIISLDEEIDFENKKLSKKDSNDLHLLTTEDSSPDLVEFINENEDPALVNLESGYLNLVLEGEDKVECIFESFEEDQMILEVGAEYKAQEGDSLSVWVTFIYNKCRIEIELSGIVSDIEIIENKKKLIDVSFAVSEAQRYDYFMSLFEKRQNSINDFMELARGY